MAFVTTKTVPRDVATAFSRAAVMRSSSSVHQRVVRGLRGVLWSITCALVAAQTAHGQSSEPPLEPIPMPAPVAKARGQQVPTPAPRAAQANYEQSGSEAVSSPTEVIVESPPAVAPAASAEVPVMEGPAFQLDANTGEQVVVEQAPQDPLPAAPPAEITEPYQVPVPVPYSNPPAVIMEQATTARAYYVAPSIQVFLPRSTATYRRAYYAPDVEYPVGVPGPRVGVFRRPVINVTLGGPPVMPAGFYVPGPVPNPAEFGVMVPPGVIPVGVIPVGPPPFVPGQPVRNAIRTIMW